MEDNYEYLTSEDIAYLEDLDSEEWEEEQKQVRTAEDKWKWQETLN